MATACGSSGRDDDDDDRGFLMLVVSMATVLESCSRRSRWSLLGWTEPLN